MRTSRTLAYWVACMVLWLLLTWKLRPDSLVAGVALSLVTALIFGNYLPLSPARLFNPRRWFWLLVYVPVFAWECLKANVDVAMRVLAPGLNLKPGIVRIRTTLKSPIARTFLANSITLTPGTMVVEIKEDVLYIHWIDVKTDDPDAAGRIIKGPFEKLLSRIFD